VDKLLDPVTGDYVVDVLSRIDKDLLSQKCLDHGFVKVLDCMPRLIPADQGMADFALADAARISYQKGTRKLSSDAGLIDNLIRNEHTSPIEQGEFKFHIRLPIFVMRQLVRHRTASLNEESARYSELASDFYVPDVKDWAMNTTANKQATVKYEITPEIATVLANWVRTHNDESYKLYQELLDGSPGSEVDIASIPPIAREQARMVLGVNIYTQCVWKIDLKNLFHFLRLRLDSHAQYEIRVFALAMARVVEAVFPVAWKSFKNNFIDGVRLSGEEIEIILYLMRGEYVPACLYLSALGWTERRLNEFKSKVAPFQFNLDPLIIKK
jgi:thymidylate synthase (FAD)